MRSTPVPHNDYVTKRRALNVFIDGLAEFGVDKGLINNKELVDRKRIESF